MQSGRMTALTELVRSVRSIVENEENVNRRVEKAEFDFATMVDLKIQEHIARNLEVLYPGSQFMGEEGAGKAPDLNEPTWILDPIDGTTNLIHRYPQCAVALALMEKRQITLGIVFNPFLDQMFTAEKGRGAWLDGKPIRVSRVERLHESLVSIGTSPYTKARAGENFSLAREVFTHCQDIRRCGAAALEIAYVAMGVAEGYYERGLKPWDYAAGKILLEEAGGRMSAMDGAEIPTGLASDCLATNGLVHEEMLSLTAKAR